MPKFYTSFDVPESRPEPECPLTKCGYIYDEVTESLVETETIPFYEEIQSHYESTRLSHKLEQFKRGNALALGVPRESFVDVSNVPTNLADVLNSRQKASQEFANLPKGIRDLFGDNFDNFTKSLQDGSYGDKLNEYARGFIKDTGNSLGKQSGQATNGGIN